MYEYFSRKTTLLKTKNFSFHFVMVTQVFSVRTTLVSEIITFLVLPLLSARWLCLLVVLSVAVPVPVEAFFLQDDVRNTELVLICRIIPAPDNSNNYFQIFIYAFRDISDFGFLSLFSKLLIVSKQSEAGFEPGTLFQQFFALPSQWATTGPIQTLLFMINFWENKLELQ